jgi:KaiC/GvpD/RAD55 family RecA-like ATPase
VSVVSGATGTGKTLTVAQFLAGGAAAGERCLLLAFEESRDQLVRNARGWGIDFDRMEQEGLLRLVCDYPEVTGLEDWLIRIKDLVEEFRPNRIALDSLSALERGGSIKAFREFVIGLTSFIKHQEITGLLTSTTPSLMGGHSITESHISTLTDSIILLRYVEVFGEMKRGMTILKMRGSLHDKDIRVDTFASSGPGGQSVNTTMSAVRLTHIPTNTVVSCQDEKSQIKNKEKAMKVLRARVYDKFQREVQAEYDANRKQAVGTGDRSERIRTYNFPQNRVTDHRIGLTIQKLDQILQGKLQEVIDALIMEDQALRMEQMEK